MNTPAPVVFRLLAVLAAEDAWVAALLKRYGAPSSEFSPRPRQPWSAALAERTEIR